MALWEERTRVSIFLPNNSAGEAFVVSGAIAQLSGRYGGCTHSLEHPAIFKGYWRVRDYWVRDEIVWLMVDVPEPFGNAALISYLSGLRDELKQAYQRAGMPQDEIWITCERAYRVA